MGCIHAADQADNRQLCPFCRTPAADSDGEVIKSLKKRVVGDDALAMYNLSYFYERGEGGLPQDYDKAMELLLRAGELGCATAYYNLASFCYNGRGVERDAKRAKYYNELSAVGGYVIARHNLGCMERDAGIMDRAVKHWMIAAGAGFDDSLNDIQDFFLRACYER